MLKELRDYQLSRTKDRFNALAAKLKQNENQVAKLHDRIIESSVPSVIAAYEERIRKMEIEKQVLKEKMATSTKPAYTLEDTHRMVLEFLANPLNLRSSSRLEDRRAVLKLAFCDRLEYSRENEFRTANLALLFEVLGNFLGGENQMAHPARHRWAPSLLEGLRFSETGARQSREWWPHHIKTPFSTKKCQETAPLVRLQFMPSTLHCNLGDVAFPRFSTISEQNSCSCDSVSAILLENKRLTIHRACACACA